MTRDEAMKMAEKTVDRLVADGHYRVEIAETTDSIVVKSENKHNDLSSPEVLRLMLHGPEDVAMEKEGTDTDTDTDTDAKPPPIKPGTLCQFRNRGSRDEHFGNYLISNGDQYRRHGCVDKTWWDKAEPVDTTNGLFDEAVGLLRGAIYARYRAASNRGHLVRYGDMSRFLDKLDK